MTAEERACYPPRLAPRNGARRKRSYDIRIRLRKRISKLTRARRPALQPERLQRLEERLQHLEALVEGLQDAIHRDSVRHDERMAQLERKTEPEAVAKALSDDARRRGL